MFSNVSADLWNKWFIIYEIATLTFDCVRGTGPVYFSSIACTVADNSGHPGLRSAECGDLFVPRNRTTWLGRRSFFITAPVVWNSLPLHLRSLSISRSQFRAGLKTHLFRLAFHRLFLWELLKRLNWTELMCCSWWLCNQLIDIGVYEHNTVRTLLKPVFFKTFNLVCKTKIKFLVGRNSQMSVKTNKPKWWLRSDNYRLKSASVLYDLFVLHFLTILFTSYM